MESHAKHGDSIYWSDSQGLLVNLYIPSQLDWAERHARIVLETGYPLGESVRLRVDSIRGRDAFDIAMRIPAWCTAPAARLNGKAFGVRRDESGYVRVHRRWQAGDVVELELPMRLRFEPTPDDSATVALLRGPLVLAADLGPASEPFNGPEPALVGDDPLAAIAVTQADQARYETRAIGRPTDLSLAPFFSQHDRRTAVYFKRYTPAEWQAALTLHAAEIERAAALDARSLDIIRLGLESDEKAHALSSDISYAVSYRFRPGRDARTGGFLEFDAAVREEPLVLRATYWGGERDRHFHIEVDGARIATQALEGERPGEFIERDYALPAQLLAGKSRIRIRFQPEPGFTAGPIFGCRILAAGATIAAAAAG
jgi:hypothetical protein